MDRGAGTGFLLRARMGYASHMLRSLVLPIHRLATVLLLLGYVVGFAPRAWGQLPTFDTADRGVWLDDLKTIVNQQSVIGDSSATAIGRVPRLRLFRFAPGFLADPLGLQDDDSGLPGMPSPASATQDNGPEWIQVGMGSDNPYFDLRRPGDPGGYGYSRVNTQVSLLDLPATACAVGVQAVTPAGAQFGGLPDGPTVVTPSFSVFHAVNDRLALQGFVSKNVPLYDSSGAPLQRNLQCGLALQRPLLTEGPETWRNLFMTVGALGQIVPERDGLRLVSKCDVLPGVQWHVNDNWWLSSAVLMPVGPFRTAPGQWQLSCSFQF